MKNESLLRREVIEVCHAMHSQGFVTSLDGNVSALLPRGRILITPSGRPKGASGCGSA